MRDMAQLYYIGQFHYILQQKIIIIAIWKFLRYISKQYALSIYTLRIASSTMIKKNDI